MNFLNTRLSSGLEASKQLVNQIFNLFPSPLTFHDLKLLVFTAYNIWQPNWMFASSSLPLIDENNQSSLSQQQEKNYQFKSRDDFEKMHKKVMILITNRGQNEHAQKIKDHEERAKNLDYNFRTSSSRTPLRQAQGELADDHIASLTPDNVTSAQQ